MEAEAASFTGYIIGVLQDYGLAGLVMLVMGFVIRALWQDNRLLRTAMFEAGTKSIEAHLATSNALTLLRSDLMQGRSRDHGNG